LSILTVERGLDGKFIRMILIDNLAESIIDLFQPDGHRTITGIPDYIIREHGINTMLYFDQAEAGDESSWINTENDHTN